jgi:ketose-bisphosphate aldolase
MENFLFNKILKKADEESYAVGAFNFHTILELISIVEAAHEESSPIIVMPKFETIDFINTKNVRYIESIVNILKEQFPIPIILHLDHAVVFSKGKGNKKYLNFSKTYKKISTCVNSGYDSIMFDGSLLPLNENINKTLKIIEIAHKSGVSVEGEVGIINSASNSGAPLIYSDVDEIQQYVERTNIDALAPAIGTVHASYQRRCNLNFSLLEQINKITDKPLVLHGGSGVSDDAIIQSIKYGINKVNIGTNMKIIFSKTLREELSKRPNEIDPRKYLPPIKKNIKKFVKKKIRILGSNNKI